MIKVLVFILISEIFGTIGHIYFKKGANLLEVNTGVRKWLDNLIKSLFSGPVIIIGVIAMALGLIFWLVALKIGDLSVVYSLRSMQFIFVLLASFFFLGERIDSMKIIGTILITVGIVFIVIS